MTGLISQDEVRRALATMLEPGAVFEIRAVGAQLSRNRRTSTVSGYFDNADACLSELKKLTTAKGIYFTLNPVNAALLARCANRLDYAEKSATTNDQHILLRRWLLLDVDFKRPSGISTTDAEKETTKKKTREIYTYLKGRGWPLPIVADSGNAYHLDYRIELSCVDDGLIERTLDALAGCFDGEGVELDRGVHNPSRIIKLYGSLVCKGDNRKDRPWRLSKILDAPESLQVVSVEQLHALVDELQPEQTEKSKAAVSRSPEGNSKPSKEQIREMLAVIQKRPHYDDWFKVVAAVGDALPDNDAIEVLNEWSEEEVKGEYAKKLQSGFSEIHVGTLIHLARQHGWTGRTQASQTVVDLHAGAIREPVELPPPPPPYVPPPLDLLPQVLQKFVCVGAAATDVDTSFLFLPVLSELAACIGISRSVRIKEGYVEPAIIWTANVAPSGDGKSPGIRIAIRPQLLREMELKRENDKENAKYEKKLAAWDATPKAKRTDVRPKKPAEQVCWMDDTTIEAIARRLNENARGLLLAKGELSHWFASFDQYRDKGGSDVARWLQLYDGDLFAVDRVTGERNYRIPNPRISIASGVQTDTLGRLLTPEYFERGLPARILWAMPKRDGPRKFTKKVVSPELFAEVALLFSDLRSLKPDQIKTEQDQPEHDEQEQEKQDRLTPKLLPLSLEAEQIFTAFYDEVGKIMYDATPRAAAQWSKLIGGSARLALVGQLAHDANAEKISGAIMKHAVALSRWFGREAERIFSQLAETPEQRERRELIEFIKRRGGAVSVRDTTHYYWRLKGLTEQAEFELNALAKHGLGKWEELRPPGPGRPTNVLRLLPASPSPQLAKIPKQTDNFGDGDAPNSQKNEGASRPDTEAETLAADESGVVRL